MTDESRELGKPCEGCGARAPHGLWDYCEWCSEDLCPQCMTTQRCRQSPGGGTTSHMPSELIPTGDEP